MLSHHLNQLLRFITGEQIVKFESKCASWLTVFVFNSNFRGKQPISCPVDIRRQVRLYSHVEGLAAEPAPGTSETMVPVKWCKTTRPVYQAWSWSQLKNTASISQWPFPCIMRCKCIWKLMCMSYFTSLMIYTLNSHTFRAKQFFFYFLLIFPLLFYWA